MQGFRNGTDTKGNPNLTFTDDLDAGIIAHINHISGNVFITTQSTVEINPTDLATLIKQLAYMQAHAQVIAETKEREQAGS